MGDWTYLPFEKALKKVSYTKKIPKKKFLDKGTYPIVSQEAEFINGYWNQKEDVFHIESPVVIFGDHTKVVKYIDFDFVLGADGVKVLAPIDSLESRFLGYFLENAPIRDLGYARHFKLLKEVKVPLPPIPEQQRIVAILDQAFADIEKARTNAEKNLKNARELFDSYLNQVFSKEAVLSGCPLVTLSDCCIIRPPKSEAKALLKSDDFVSFVPMDSLGINRKSLFLDKTKKLEDVSGSYTYFADGDVLLAKITPCFENGKLGIAKGLKNGIGFGSSEFIVFRPDERLEAEYLYYFLNQQAFRDNGQAMMTGAVGHKRVPKDFIENIKIPLRTVYEQQLIVASLDKLSMEVQQLEKGYQEKLNSLEELKKSLLQKAFSGELTKTEGHAA